MTVVPAFNGDEYRWKVFSGNIGRSCSGARVVRRAVGSKWLTKARVSELEGSNNHGPPGHPRAKAIRENEWRRALLERQIQGQRISYLATSAGIDPRRFDLDHIGSPRSCIRRWLRLRATTTRKQDAYAHQRQGHGGREQLPVFIG